MPGSGRDRRSGRHYCRCRQGLAGRVTDPGDPQAGSGIRLSRSAPGRSSRSTHPGAPASPAKDSGPSSRPVTRRARSAGPGASARRRAGRSSMPTASPDSSDGYRFSTLGPGELRGGIIAVGARAVRHLDCTAPCRRVVAEPPARAEAADRSRRLPGLRDGRIAPPRKRLAEKNPPVTDCWTIRAEGLARGGAIALLAHEIPLTGRGLVLTEWRSPTTGPRTGSSRSTSPGRLQPTDDGRRAVRRMPASSSRSRKFAAAGLGDLEPVRSRPIAAGPFRAAPLIRARARHHRLRGARARHSARATTRTRPVAW